MYVISWLSALIDFRLINYVSKVPQIVFGSLQPPSLWKESEKAGLKLNIQKTKIVASGPITSWEIDGETVETVTEFIFLSSKITADCDYSYEIKRRLLLGRKAMTKLCWQRSI